MNNGIKNKLKELIGEQVGILDSDYGVRIFYPSLELNSNKILRFEEEDCVVFDRGKEELLVPIHHITSIRYKK